MSVHSICDRPAPQLLPISIIVGGCPSDQLDDRLKTRAVEIGTEGLRLPLTVWWNGSRYEVSERTWTGW